jgi:hypothetical protein
MGSIPALRVMRQTSGRSASSSCPTDHSPSRHRRRVCSPRSGDAGARSQSARSPERIANSTPNDDPASRAGILLFLPQLRHPQRSPREASLGPPEKFERAQRQATVWHPSAHHWDREPGSSERSDQSSGATPGTDLFFRVRRESEVWKHGRAEEKRPAPRAPRRLRARARTWEEPEEELRYGV